MNETFSAFYKIKLEILSNLLKEVTGLTLKANKNFLRQFTRGWGPNWTVNDGKALYNIFNFYWYSSANPIPRELAGDFVSSPSASERADRNVKPVRF